MPHKVWAVGEEVLAADFNTYVQQQVVATFPSYAAMKTAVPAPPDGFRGATLDDGRLYTFRAAATAYPGGVVINAPANRWEVQTFFAQTVTTSASGDISITAASLALDGVIYGNAQVAWAANNVPGWCSTRIASNTLNIRTYGGAAAIVASTSCIFQGPVFGWRV